MHLLLDSGLILGSSFLGNYEKIKRMLSRSVWRLDIRDFRREEENVIPHRFSFYANHD